MRYSKEKKTMWLEDWKASGKRAWTYTTVWMCLP